VRQKSKIKNQKSKLQKGFTLVETLVAISIFTILILATCFSIVYLYRVSAFDIQQAQAIDSARRGVDIMVREIREATYADTGAYLIESAQNQSFIFYSDIDWDQNIERIRYFLDGKILKKGETEATGTPRMYDSKNEKISILSEYVQNGSQPIFSYFDKNNNQLTDLSKVGDITLVKVNLIINVDPKRPPSDFTLISNAQIRNLKEKQ
jgi:prepilin-type N-terminal cleavage/methylation domain-containing protein